MAVAETHPALTLVLAMSIGVIAQVLARHLRLPGIVLLLTSGVALGPDGLGWIEPDALGGGLLLIVQLAVAVVLFEGGLNLEVSRLRRAQEPIRRLVTLGAGVTLVGAAAALLLLFGGSLAQALLFGSLVIVTGPTVIGPLVQDLRLRPRIATVLEAEGVLIDPVGAIVAVLMLEIALAPGADSVAMGALELFLRLGFGLLAGGLGGFAIAALLRVRGLVPEGLENVLVLSCVLLLFQSCEEFVSESGILAVAIAGVVVGNQRSHVDRDLREFKDQISVLLIGMLFVLLAADVRLEEVRELGWPGLAVVGALVFVIRPVGVWLCTRGSDLTMAERTFVAWLAPRGIVAAAVASMAAGALEAAGIPGGGELRAMVFLTIATTVLLAGVTALPVAHLLGVRLPGRERVAILGAQGLGLALARELKNNDRSVVFLDSNPHNCRRAEEEGFQVVFGNALKERTLQRARFEGVGTAVGLTANQVLNSVFATRARELFGVSRCYAAIQQADLGLAPELAAGQNVRMLFDGPHEVERWDVRDRHEEIAVEHWCFSGSEEASAEAESIRSDSDLLVLLCVVRGGRANVMHPDFELKSGDELAVAIHRPEREQAHAALRSRGFEPLQAEVAP